MSDAQEDFNATEIKQQIAQHILTEQEKNDIIKEAWIKRMTEEKPLPVDLYDKFTKWVKNIIATAQQAVQAKAQQVNAEQKGGSK